MRKELSDNAREGPAYRKMEDSFSKEQRNPLRYGVGNYLVRCSDGTYKNSTLAH